MLGDRPATAASARGRSPTAGAAGPRGGERRQRFGRARYGPDRPRPTAPRPGSCGACRWGAHALRAARREHAPALWRRWTATAVAHDAAALGRCSYLSSTPTPAAEQIVLDLDATDDPLHGQQEGASSTAITTATAICRSMFSAAAICWRPAQARQHRRLGRRRRESRASSPVRARCRGTDHSARRQRLRTGAPDGLVRDTGSLPVRPRAPRAVGYPSARLAGTRRAPRPARRFADFRCARGLGRRRRSSPAGVPAAAPAPPRFVAPRSPAGVTGKAACGRSRTVRLFRPRFRRLLQ